MKATTRLIAVLTLLLIPATRSSADCYGPSGCCRCYQRGVTFVCAPAYPGASGNVECYAFAEGGCAMQGTTCNGGFCDPWYGPGC